MPRAFAFRSTSAFSIAAIACCAMPPTDWRVTPCRYAVIFSTGRGSQPISRAPSLRITPARPSEPYDSMNSDQPVTPSSVLIFRNEKSRQPALQCRSSILVMRMLPSLAVGRMLGRRHQRRKAAHVIGDRGGTGARAGAPRGRAGNDRRR